MKNRGYIWSPHRVYEKQKPVTNTVKGCNEVGAALAEGLNAPRKSLRIHWRDYSAAASPAS